MKIVCICENSTSTNCVASGLMRDHEIPLVVVPDFGAAQTGNRKKKRPKGKVFTRAVNRLFFELIARKPSADQISQSIKHQCSGDLDLTSVCDNFVSVPAHAMNSKSTAALIAAHEPDLLFVCGAPILKNSIFQIPKYGSVNFHYGYSPKYKGQHTLLWAFMKGDNESLGGTFLKIDKGVDTGTPIMFVFPEVKKSDTLEDVEAKLAALARDNASQAMQAAANVSPPNRETAPKALEAKEQGFMVRFADYGAKEHLAYCFRLFRNRFQRGSTLREEEVTVL